MGSVGLDQNMLNDQVSDATGCLCFVESRAGN